ncbi:hypothetical protein A0W34_32095 (plasmid) [Rhodococcus sp. BH4]|nr:hypothetical protein A0W34_32095 [Rhodococcus sp. BH4]
MIEAMNIGRMPLQTSGKLLSIPDSEVAGLLRLCDNTVRSFLNGASTNEHSCKRRKKRWGTPPHLF